MSKFELSIHAEDMLLERDIAKAWLWRALEDPDDVYRGQDTNMHYIKAIIERENRVLHVINAQVSPNRVVTVFFDRRLRKNRSAI